MSLVERAIKKMQSRPAEAATPERALRNETSSFEPSTVVGAPLAPPLRPAARV
jgi:hypothetical protein